MEPRHLHALSVPICAMIELLPLLNSSRSPLKDAPGGTSRRTSRRSSSRFETTSPLKDRRSHTRRTLRASVRNSQYEQLAGRRKPRRNVHAESRRGPRHEGGSVCERTRINPSLDAAQVRERDRQRGCWMRRRAGGTRSDAEVQRTGPAGDRSERDEERFPRAHTHATTSQAWEAAARSDPATLHRHCTGPLLRGLVEFVEFRATNGNGEHARLRSASYIIPASSELRLLWDFWGPRWDTF